MTGADPVEEGTIRTLTRMTLFCATCLGLTLSSVGQVCLHFAQLCSNHFAAANVKVMVFVARDLLAASHVDASALFCGLHDM